MGFAAAERPRAQSGVFVVGIADIFRIHARAAIQMTLDPVRKRPDYVRDWNPAFPRNALSGGS
jgi:hypothetical protein